MNILLHCRFVNSHCTTFLNLNDKKNCQNHRFTLMQTLGGGEGILVLPQGVSILSRVGVFLLFTFVYFILYTFSTL